MTSRTHEMHSHKSYIRKPPARAHALQMKYSSSGTENESTTYSAPCNGCARKVANVTLHIVMSIRPYYTMGGSMARPRTDSHGLPGTAASLFSLVPTPTTETEQLL